MRIRTATATDAAAIAAIYAPIVADTPISFEETPPRADEMARRIAETTRTHPWLVAEDARGVAGYAYASRHRDRAAYRWAADVSVYVAERARRQGVGAALYRALIALLERQGFLRLYAGVVVPNAASEALHRAAGFAEIGTYRAVGYKLGRWHDVRWYGRSLGPGETPREPLAFPELDGET
jgi:phosphinothricin acetyltransferase